MPEINQQKLEDKLKLFLVNAGENEGYTHLGICNGFAFMNFRADFFEMEDENLSRMLDLEQRDDAEIVEMGKLYNNYKKRRRLLFEINPVASSNSLIKKKEEELRALKKEAKESQTQTTELLKEEIKKLKNEQNIFIEGVLASVFNAEELKKIDKAKDLEGYIHLMLAAFSADDYNYKVEGEGQIAYVEMLQLLAPVDAKESELKAAKVFEVAFNFTEKELIDLFYDERIIHKGDYIVLNSSNHAMYLSYKNGKFRLFNPGEVEIASNTPEALVAAIKYHYYTKFGLSTNYMSVCVSVFEKMSPGKEKAKRPEATAVVENMLAARPSHLNINETYNSWDRASSVYMAARYGHVSVIEVLAKVGANLSTLTTRDETPMYIAAQNNHSEVIKVLKARGASLNQWNDIGNTPLMIAARCGHVKTVETLAKLGAKLNVHQKQAGYTAVMFAAMFDHAEVIKILFDYRAGIEKHDIFGKTPLHIAIEKSHFSCIRTLIYCGAQLDIPDKSGKTPLYYADAKTRLFIDEQVKLKESFEKLKQLIFHMLRPGVEVDLDHTTEDIPNLHLNIYGCSPTELAVLRNILKKLGIEAQQDGERLVVMNIDPTKVLTPGFVREFQASKSILTDRLKNELEAINSAFKRELSSAEAGMNKLTFHFSSYDQAVQDKMTSLRNDFLSKLHRYVELSLDDAKAKIDVYRQYREWPVIKEHRKGGLYAIGRTDAEIAIDEKIHALQSKLTKR